MSICSINKLDAIFSFTPKILYCRKDTFKSTFGGIFSILYVIVLLGVFIPLLKNIIENERKMIHYFPLFYSNSSNQEIFRNLTLSLHIIDLQNGNPIQFDPTVVKASLSSKIVNSENRLYHMPKITCPNENSMQLDLVNANQEGGLLMDNITLFRNFSYFNYFEIKLTKCSNITSDGNGDTQPCKPLHLINQIIFNSMIQFKMRLEYYDLLSSKKTFNTKVFNIASNSKISFAPDTQLIYLTPLVYMKDTNSFVHSALKKIHGNFLDYEATYIDSSGDDDDDSSFHTIVLLSNFYQMTEIMQEKVLYSYFPAILCIFYTITGIMNFLYQRIQEYFYRTDFDTIFVQKLGKLLDESCENEREGILNFNLCGSNEIGSISNIQDVKVNNNLLPQDEVKMKMSNNCINNQDSKTNNLSSSPIKHHSYLDDSTTNIQNNCPDNKQHAQSQEKIEAIKFIPDGTFSFQDPLNVAKNNNSSLSQVGQGGKNQEVVDNAVKGSKIFIYSKGVGGSKSAKIFNKKTQSSRCGKIYLCMISACKKRDDEVTKSQEKARKYIAKFTSIDEISCSILSLENLISKLQHIFNEGKDKDFSPVTQSVKHNPFDLQNSNIYPII